MNVFEKALAYDRLVETLAMTSIENSYKQFIKDIESLRIEYSEPSPIHNA